MSGNIEVGKCEVCGKENVQLTRTYFNYNLKCECHSPNHFEKISHCKDCEPIEPTYTKVSLLTRDLRKIDNILDILKEVSYKLSGLEEVSEDEGSFNIIINTHNSFNFDWTYTTIIIHNNMCSEDPNHNNTLVYVFISYEWKWLSSATVNNKNMTKDDYKELFNYLKIAGLMDKE